MNFIKSLALLYFSDGSLLSPMMENSQDFLNQRFSPFCVWFMRNQAKMLAFLGSIVPVLQLVLCLENVKMLNEMFAVQNKIKVAFPEAESFLKSHGRKTFKRFAILYLFISSYAFFTFFTSMHQSMLSFFSFMLASIPAMMFFYIMAYYFAILQIIIGCQKFLCKCLEENLSKGGKKRFMELLKIMFLMSSLFRAKERFVATLKLPICIVMYGVLCQLIFHVR